MSIVKEFNGLNGSAEYSRAEISEMIKQAEREDQPAVANRLRAVLHEYQDEVFTLENDAPEIENVPAYLLAGLDYQNDAEPIGLAKAVSPDDIYDYITDLIINTVNVVGHLPWQKEWTGSGTDAAKNYVSKKEYSGANFILNFDIKFDDDGLPYLVPINFIQPYYLTFNQIKEAKATLKQGSKARRVIYYTMIFAFDNDFLKFKTSDRQKWTKFIIDNGISAADLKKYGSRFAMLKYYNVFRADDCTGLKFPEREIKTTSPIEASQIVIDNYKNPPKYTFTGDQAYYQPATDTLNMPKIEAFSTEAFYYCTFFHEMTHSTGHSKRLNRGNDTRVRDGSKEDKKAYAFEELIAELGAVFLCGETGILFYTKENSAKYLHGWNERLVGELENDNRFFLKASAQAQKAVNHILGREVETPDDKAAEPKKEETKTTYKIKKPENELEALNPKSFANKPKSVAVATAIRDIISLPKYKGINERQAQILYKHFAGKDHQSDVELTSEYEIAIMQKDSTYHEIYDENLELTQHGADLVNSILGRVTSLKNQKSNYAMFDGLKGAELEVIEPVHVVAKPLCNNSKIQNIGAGNNSKPGSFYKVNGEVGKFLQKVERKPLQSVVISLDGEQGAGKTTTLYHIMEAFGSAGNRCLFLSGEEHPTSSLAIDKANKYLSATAKKNIDTIAEVDSTDELFSIIAPYEIIFIDSWQKLLRMVGNIKLDEDLRKRFDGKVFVIIFQQTTTGRTKGGAEVVFDGDIVTKMVKEARFSDNYAYFDKHRYTEVPLETIRYNIAGGKCYNPEEPNAKADETPDKTKFTFNVVEH